MANISKYKTTINGVSTVYDIKDSNAIPKSGGNVVTGNIGPTTSGTISLGDSSHKWSKINGVDPGALGMPSDNKVEITSLFNSNNEWTATANGWVATRCNYPIKLINKTLSTDESVTSTMLGTFNKGDVGFGYAGAHVSDSNTLNNRFMIPVRKNDVISISTNSNATWKAFFIPCKGNI